MISRVAESCFWLNRYVERVETLSRMLDVNLSMQLDVDLPSDRWLPLVVVTGQGEPYRAGPGGDAPDDAERVQTYLTWNEDNPSSILRSLAGADHVRVACGRTYRDASPTSGTIYQGGGTETLDISVRVEEVS